MEKTKQKEEIRLPGMFSLLCAVVYGVCLPVSQHTVVHDYDNLFIWLPFSVHVVAIVPFRALFCLSFECVASPGDGDTAFC